MSPIRCQHPFFTSLFTRICLILPISSILVIPGYQLSPFIVRRSQCNGYHTTSWSKSPLVQVNSFKYIWPANLQDNYIFSLTRFSLRIGFNILIFCDVIFARFFSQWPEWTSWGGCVTILGTFYLILLSVNTSVSLLLFKYFIPE